VQQTVSDSFHRSDELQQSAERLNGNRNVSLIRHYEQSTTFWEKFWISQAIGNLPARVDLQMLSQLASRNAIRRC